MVLWLPVASGDSSIHALCSLISFLGDLSCMVSVVCCGAWSGRVGLVLQGLVALLWTLPLAPLFPCSPLLSFSWCW